MDPVEPKKHKEYDGIIENDNPMPRWWLVTFYLTIIFSIFYFGATQFMGKLKISDEYAHALKEHQMKSPQGGGDTSEQAGLVLKMVSDPTAVSAGKEIFTLRCAMCHAPDGGGTIGPNLTDNFWLNCDGKAPGIIQVILNGVDGKGMPPWKPVLSEDEVRKVTAFVLTLRGTKPANPKAAQGKEYPL